MNLFNSGAGIYSRKASGSSALSYIDKIEIDEIQSPINGQPTVHIGRVGSAVPLSAKAYLSGVEVTGGVAYTWYITDHDTGTAIDTVFGKFANVVGLTEGRYDITLEATSINTQNRHADKGLRIKKALFTEGTSDLVLDLTTLRDGSWINPIPSQLTVTGLGSNNIILTFTTVDRPDFKIYVKGSSDGCVTFDDLRGTSGNYVRFQAPSTGRATFNATNGSLPYCIRWRNGNRFIEFDGHNTGHEYGFEFKGHVTSASSGQMFFISGEFCSNFEVHGIELNGQRGTGIATSGGAAIQIQATYSATCNATNHSFGTMEKYGCYVHHTFGEGGYWGYFESVVQGTGFRPYPIDELYIYRNIISHTNRDSDQLSSTAYGEISDNYFEYPGEESNASHNSAISLNGGCGDIFMYRNYAYQCDTYCSGQNDDNGTGNYHFYSSLAIQRTTPLSGTMNQLFFLNVEGINCNFHLYNFSMKCPAVAIAPACIQYDGVFISPNFTFRSCVIVSSGSDQSPNAELRIVNTSGTDKTNWSVTGNQLRRLATESQLLVNSSTLKPTAKTSLVYNNGFDWEARFGVGIVKGGQRDIEGYSLLVDIGITNVLSAGCWSGQELYVYPDIIAPVFTSTTIDNVTASTFRINCNTDEAATHYYIVVPAAGFGTPTPVQVKAGQDFLGAAAFKSGSTLGTSTQQTPTGLAIGTAYKICLVAEDVDGNLQALVTTLDQTTSATGVRFIEAGVGNSRGSTGTILTAIPTTDQENGDLLILQVTIASAAGVIGTQTGWTDFPAAYQIGSSDAGQQALFMRLDDGTLSGDHTTTFSTDAAVVKTARIYRFRGTLNTIGSILESLSNGQANSSTVNGRSVTSSLDGALAVNMIAVNDDNPITALTGNTGGTWSEASAEFTTTSGNDAAISCQVADLALAGTITGGSFIMAGADPYSAVGFALKPAVLP